MTRRPALDTHHIGLAAVADLGLLVFMITVEDADDAIRVTIPKGDLAPGRLNSFLDWLRLESVARRSALTEAAADELAESAKQSWWAANKGRFVPAEKQ